MAAWIGQLAGVVWRRSLLLLRGRLARAVGAETGFCGSERSSLPAGSDRVELVGWKPLHLVLAEQTGKSISLFRSKGCRASTHSLPIKRLIHFLLLFFPHLLQGKQGLIVRLGLRKRVQGLS